MDRFGKSIEDIIKDTPYQIAAGIIADKSSSQGIEFTARERQKLVDHLKTDPAGNFRFRKFRLFGRKVVIETTEEDLSVFDRLYSKFMEDGLEELMGSLTDEFAGEGFLALKRSWPHNRHREDRRRRGFERRLQKRWGVGLDKMRMLLDVAREFGESTHSRLQDESNIACPNLVDVLARLHARGCQVAEEIVGLMSAGLADGAMARWRTLHEIAVVAMFLRERGEGMAERYIDHQAVESHKAVHEYQDYCERLGYEEMSAKEVEAQDRAFEDVMKKYGPGFERPYGWAGGEGGLKDATFPNIEKEASVDHLRGHYRMASHNVHANPKGIFFKIGLIEDSACLLAGPSNMGLADPGHAAAISLMQISSALGLLRPTVNSLVTLKILVLLSDEVGEALLEAHRRLEDDIG